MLIFWLLSFGIAWAITVPPALHQTGLLASSPVPAGLGILIGIAPIIAAAVAAARQGESRAYWRSLRRFPKPWWTTGFALMFPAALLAIAQLMHSVSGDPIDIQIDASLATYALLWAVLAFGEEAGWRGFALPRLTERFGFWVGSAILGLVWCVWHFPKLLGSPYLGSLEEALPLIGLFSIQIVIANFIVCWLYYRSGRSVLATTVYHMSFNVAATAYFAAATDLVVTAALAATVALIALFDPRPNKDVQGSADS